MKCIICKEFDKDFNEEHVSPESSGGKYKINNVCQDCNSPLGKRKKIILNMI